MQRYQIKQGTYYITPLPTPDVNDAGKRRYYSSTRPTQAGDYYHRELAEKAKAELALPDTIIEEVNL